MFNGSATIGRTLASLVSGTWPHWHAVVIDDGSTDAGRGSEVVANRAESDPRISLISQTNSGLAGARNAGLDWIAGRLAAGSYSQADEPGHTVMFLDCDDTVAPDGLRRLVQTAEHTGFGAYGGFNMVDAAGQMLATQRPGRPVLDLDALLDLEFVVTHCLLTPWSVLADRRFTECGPLQRVEDYQMWYRLAGEGARWAAVGDGNTDPVVSYTITRASMSQDLHGMFSAAVDVVRQGHIDAKADRQRMATAVARTALTWATRLAMRPQTDQLSEHLAASTSDNSIESAIKLVQPFVADLAKDDALPSLIAGAIGGAVVCSWAMPLTASDGRGGAVLGWLDPAAKWINRLCRSCAVARRTSSWRLSADVAAELARLTVSNRTVARCIAERISLCVQAQWSVPCQSALPPATVLLYGLGRNAGDVTLAITANPRLAGEIKSGRLLLRGRDHAIEPDSHGAAVWQSRGLIVEGQDLPLADSTIVVVTPVHDAILLNRAGVASTRYALRWSEIASYLADQTHSQILAAIEAAAFADGHPEAMEFRPPCRASA